jgi:hypothetical protein
MRAKEVVKLFVENRPVGGGAATFYEYSDGIISMDIRRGMNEYLGPHTQIDTGSLIVTSRNPNLDPMAAGSLVRFKNRIKVQVDDQIIFIGRIENIDVKYQPKSEPPIITITAFDYVRDLVENRWTNQTYLDQAYDVFTLITGVNDNDPGYAGGLPWSLDYINNGAERVYGGATCTQLMKYVDYRDMVPDFAVAASAYIEPSIDISDSTPTGVAKYAVGNWIGNNYSGWKLNDTFYSIFSKLALSNLGWFYCKADGTWSYVGRTGNTIGGHRIDFSSEAQPGTESYREINITDGFERIFNKLNVSYTGSAPFNQTPIPETTTTWTKTSSGSSGLWGLRELSLNPAEASDFEYYPNYTTFSEKFFEEAATPHREVNTITWNAMNNHNIAKNTDINDEIGIQYVSDVVSISANYRIVGIRHRIDANDWIIEYVLRNYNYLASSGEVVVPVVNASSTNVTNTETVNFSVTNAAQFISATWDFGDGTTSTSFTPSKVFSNLPPAGQTYGVTVTCVDTLGRTIQSAAVQMTVTGQTPILAVPQHYDRFTSDTVGQHWLYVNASNYDTLTWQVLNTERGVLWNPGTYTSTNHKRPTNTYPYGSFTGSGSYQTGGIIKPGSMGEVTVRVTGTNTYGTTYRDLTWDAYSTDRENINGFNARYIRIYQKYTGTSQYAYTGSFVTNNYHDINPQTNIKNIHTYNFAGTGTIIQAVNNNGTINIQDGTAFNIGTHAGYLTDLNDNTGITINTNLGTLVSGNKYRINPDWYIVIDLGSTRSLTSIFPEWDMDKDGFPFRTKKTLTSGDIYISYSTTQSNGGVDTGWSTYGSFYATPQTSSIWDAGTSVVHKSYGLSAQY